uniref:Uncharacterized protein n=1 Tax=viral metagenome TaxID=1070528 RepID=A0A6C0B7Y2_9ZZZZ
MSLVDLYSIETKFNEKKKEYLSLMDSIHYSCLGKLKRSAKCVKAATLNAEMQTCLIQMSNLSIKYPHVKSTKPLKKKQLEILQLSDKLEHDLKNLMTDTVLKQDTDVLYEHHKLRALSWGFMGILITALVIYQYKKI